MCSPELQTIAGGGGGGGGAVQTKVAVLISWDTAATVSENQIFHRDSHKELLVIYSKSFYKPLILVILGYNPDCSCIVLLLLGF